MRALLVLVVAGRAAAEELPTIDDAFPPTIRVEAGDGARVEDVQLAVASAPEPTWLTVRVSARFATLVKVSLDVPAGTRVFGLGVAHRDGGSAWGRAVPAELAHGIGGAALAWNSRSAGEDHLTLEVHAPATVDIAMHLPPLPRVAVAWGRSRVIELADVAGTVGPAKQPFANEHVGLLAAVTPASAFLEHPPPRFDRVFIARDVDKAIIRRYMKRHFRQLRRCYMAVAQWDPTVRGDVVLAFEIAPDGTVPWAAVKNTALPDGVNTCLVDEARRWQFPTSDTRTQVNYPLAFRLSG